MLSILKVEFWAFCASDEFCLIRGLSSSFLRRVPANFGSTNVSGQMTINDDMNDEELGRIHLCGIKVGGENLSSPRPMLCAVGCNLADLLDVTKNIYEINNIVISHVDQSHN